MGFERNDRGNGNNNRSFDRNNKRPSGFRDKKPEGMNNGRIENFEKPLIQLLKEINEKLDILINKEK